MISRVFAFFFLSSFFNLTLLLCSTKSTLNFLFSTYKQSDCKWSTTHHDPIVLIWTIIDCLHILIVKYPGNIFSTFYTVFLVSDPLLVKLSTAIVVYSRTRNITALHSSRAARNVNVAWLLKVSKVCHHAAVFSHATLLLRELLHHGRRAGQEEMTEIRVVSGETNLILHIETYQL